MLRSFIKSYVITLFINFILCSTLLAKEYTPSDVYAEALLIERKIKQLKAEQGLSSTWSEIAVVSGYKPRHVFHKAIEILDKISHYRVNILQLGAIPRNYTVGREITPSEVFIEVQRIHQELIVMMQAMGNEFRYGETQHQHQHKNKNKNKNKNKTPSDVYAKLSEISFALDDLLGIRGISPSDVYVRSQQIVDYATFLRRSQNQSLDIELPTKTEQKSPNHSLEAVSALVIEINQIYTGLGIEPVKTIEVPKRVIEPTDVFGSMGIVLAEFQQLQHHLGLERFIAEVELKEAKTPDDIIFNIRLATLLLPDFSKSDKIKYLDKTLLIKTPNHVFSLTAYLIKELERFTRYKGVNISPIVIPENQYLKPKHVYGKALEAIDKIVKIRENQGMGRSAIPIFPIKEVTPQEVFNLSLTIDEYLHILFQYYGMASTPWIVSDAIEYFSDKTPTDVYENMLKINHLLQLMLGNQGHGNNELFVKLNKINNDIDQIMSSLSIPPMKINGMTDENIKNIKNIKGIKSNNGHVLSDILKKLHQSKKALTKIKIRKGIEDNAKLKLPINKVATIDDAYGMAWHIEAELTELKVIFGIESTPVRLGINEDKTLLDSYHKATQLRQKLLMLSDKVLTNNISANNIPANKKKAIL